MRLTVLFPSVLSIAAAPLAHADEAQPRDHHLKTWTEVLTRIPCRDFRHNPDGSWTLPGTLIVDETGRTFTDLTYTLEPPQDNGAKVLALRCGGKTGE